MGYPVQISRLMPNTTIVIKNVSALLITFTEPKNFTIVLPHAMNGEIKGTSNQLVSSNQLASTSNQLASTTYPLLPINSSNLFFDAANLSDNSDGSFLQDDTFPSWFVLLWTLLLSVALTLGLVGNILVPLVVLTTRELKTSTNFLLVNLAMADILVLIVCLPIAMIELHTKPGVWILGQFLCKLVPFVEWSVSHASVLTILVIGFERYYAICRPLRASYTCTKMRACCCIAFTWVTSCFVSSPVMLMSELHHYESPSSPVAACYTEMENRWARGYYTLMVVTFFFVPLVLLLILYLVIARRLVRDTHTAELHRKVELPNMRARRQVVIMLVTVTVFFFVCLLPFRILSLWMMYDFTFFKELSHFQYHSMLNASRLLLYLNSAINPILYNLTSTKFRDAFSKLVRRSSDRDSFRRNTYTTGTSLSNGRPGSSRSSITSHSPKCSQRTGHYRQPSLLLQTSTPRRNLLVRYGRHMKYISNDFHHSNGGSNGFKNPLSYTSGSQTEVRASTGGNFGDVDHMPTLAEVSSGVNSSASLPSSPQKEMVKLLCVTTPQSKEGEYSDDEDVMETTLTEVMM